MTEMSKHDRRRFYILVAMFLACTLFYYFGELVDLFGWEALRFDFFYGIHDTHRLLFLAPILYTAYYYGVKASVIVTIIAVNTFLPRALFVSPYPDPLVRTVLFILVAGSVGHVLGMCTEKRRRIETRADRQRGAMLAVLDELAPAYVVVGPDRVVRYVSPALEKCLGKGAGQRCHRYLRGSPQPCPEGCRLEEVLRGATGGHDYTRPDGGQGEGLAVPCLDADGTACQLIVFPGIGRD